MDDLKLDILDNLWVSHPKNWSSEIYLGVGIGSISSLVYLIAFLMYFFPIGGQWIDYILQPEVIPSFIIVSILSSILIPLLPIGIDYPQNRSEILAVGKFAGIIPMIVINGWYLLNGVFWSLFLPFSAFQPESAIEAVIRGAASLLLAFGIFVATLTIIFIPVIFSLLLSVICVYLPVIVTYTLREQIVAALF